METWIEVGDIWLQYSVRCFYSTLELARKKIQRKLHDDVKQKMFGQR